MLAISVRDDNGEQERGGLTLVMSSPEMSLKGGYSLLFPVRLAVCVVSVS